MSVKLCKLAITARGSDCAQRGLLPPTKHLHPLSPVRQGWDAGREHFGRRTLQADRFVRRWLQLRLNAGWGSDSSGLVDEGQLHCSRSPWHGD